MKLAIVLSTQPASFTALAYKGELQANVRKIANLGYSGVELAVRDPALLQVEHLRKLLGSLSLDVPAIGTGQAYGEEGLSLTDPRARVRTQAICRIKAHIDLAVSFSATVIIGLIRGKVEHGITTELAQGWLVEALKECSGYAVTKDIKLALEPINRYETDLINTVEAGLNLVNQVGSENFGLLLDTFHMNIEEPSIEKSIRLAGERIFHFHVADSNRLYPGAGHLNFQRIVEALYHSGYNGYLSAEIVPFPDADSCAEETIAFLTPLVTVAELHP